ncbi:MAG: AraC family transcriptional regulator [Firmicutes bacterium]|nr:AraC family transcriptional regulator [Bacillota bacterium]
MLKEKNIYKDELPVNVVVANIEEYPIHFHDDMEVVYVLNGSVTLRNGYYTYTLKQGDIFILNDREMHSFTSTGETNMVMMLQLDLSYFSKYYDSLKNNFFVTDMEDDSDESLEVLRSILARIMMEILQKGYGYEHKVIESAHNLIACLMSDFQYFVMEDGKFVNEAKNKGNKILAGRLNRITDYMYDNYSRKLTLNEIAEREHLSIYYLSHVIKEATGLSFQDLLSFIRVEESEKLLLGTSKKIGAIAEETGFSAVRYYIKHFQTWYGMHPLEYRKQFTGKISSRETLAQYERSAPTEIEEAIRQQVKGVYTDYINKQKARPVIVDVNIYEDDYMGKRIKSNGLKELMERENMRPVAGPYELLKSLGETVIASGPNYMVTTASKFPGSLNNLSILVYNFSEAVETDLKNTRSKENTLNIIRKYEEEIEFLARCSGLSGEFRISRYKTFRHKIISDLEAQIHPHSTYSRREELVSQWTSLPVIEFAEFTSSDTLSLRATLKGFSAELLLIDRK